MLLRARSRAPWPSLRRSTVVGTILEGKKITSYLPVSDDQKQQLSIFKTWPIIYLKVNGLTPSLMAPHHWLLLSWRLDCTDGPWWSGGLTSSVCGTEVVCVEDEKVLCGDA